MSSACVLLAPGFEEIEAVTVIDVLRRAAVQTTLVATAGRSVAGSHGIVLEADAELADVAGERWDLVVLPGGMPGAANLRDDERVQALLRAQQARAGKIAAICAAPIALSRAGVLRERRATSYPTFASQVDCASYLEQPVVVDGPVVTSRGPATALRFALTLVAELCGAEQAASLARGMLVEGWAPR
jgi:4-methyl-5(b-hydroxyethyl)-thiazole monophosphate biosynthesis